MTVNRGKQFETQIQKAFEKVPDVSIDRLLDPMAGYAGIRNICDYIVYKEPNEYYIECKSCYRNTLNYSNITENQWSGLLEKSKIPGVISGVIIWFIDHDKTIFVPIQKLEYDKKRGLKSVNITHEDTFDTGVIEITGKKKRILFDYDMTSFFNFTGGDEYGKHLREYENR